MGYAPGMSLLLRYLVKGLGWELGKTAAQEAVEELRASGDPKKIEADARAAKREAQRAAREAERARARAEKARAKEAKRRAREVESELAALKKRVDREG